MSASSVKLRRLTPKGAFSLIELIVVLGLIALLIGLIGTVQPQSGKPLEAAQRIAAAMVRAARSEALLRNRTTRLLVYREESGAPSVPCALGIVAREYRTAQGRQNAWIAIHEGAALPRGIHFAADLSAAEDAGFSLPSMRLRYPGLDSFAAPDEDDRSWYYYEFGPDGRLTQGHSQGFILTTDISERDKHTPEEQPSAGFLIHTSGRILPDGR